MKFYIDINVKGLRTIIFKDAAKDDFEKLSTEQGDLLLVVNSNYPRGICLRDGSYYEGRRDQCGLGDICTIEFDDFEPSMTLDDNPEWHDLLKERIVAVRAQEQYGPGQGIAVSERKTYGSAVARIRNQQSNWGRDGVLVYVVKIVATGPQSLKDAIALHKMILEGE
ncbi:hypothetical protein H6784_04965 [Candidatus Nomurabacteria bacterium]|nr:hypothetical protein [Candidatus Kaiserbacteria bacterium]MCB9814737.1 hypothetical protein [Candidatus Nomurabacteria bacterium]